MKCYIVRHADKEKGDFYNPVLRHRDQPISKMGEEESQELCYFFAQKNIAAIYVSDYQRTRQTITAVSTQHALIPIIDPRLNEFDNGVLDGMSKADVQQQYPDTWQAFTDRNRDFRFPEGETGAEAQKRIMQFLAEKRMAHENEEIILVSHDGIIRTLMCSIMGLPVYQRWNFNVDTCGIMEIAYQHAYETWKLIRFNQKCLP